MVTVNLTPGQHTIEMTLAGYDTLKATISISSTGSISCISVVKGYCNSSAHPGIKISSNVITGYLKASAIGMCQWATNKGGWDKIGAFDIMALVKGYTGEQSAGFTVRSADIMGAVAYYSNNKSSGNSLSGCNF